MTQALHVVQVCLPSWGGSSTVAADLALGLAAAGHRATVVSAQPPPRLALFGDAAQQVRWLPAHVGNHAALQEAGAQVVALAGTLVQLAQAERVDVIHVHYAVPHAAAAWLARLTLGAQAPRLVVSLHGTDATALAQDPQYRPLLQQALAHADLCTAPSQYLAQLAADHLNLAQRPTVVPNFIDTDHFRPATARDPHALNRYFPAAADGSPVLLHVSNFRPVKRAPVLVPLLAGLRARQPCRLLLVGDGPDRPAVEAAIAAHGLQAHAVWLPPQADCVEVLQQAAVFVLPSESEGFGLAALEAMACGTPVVATAVGGLPEVVVNGTTGLLTPAADDAALLAAVAGLLADPVLAGKMGGSACQLARAQFSRSVGLGNWLAAYERAPG